MYDPTNRPSKFKPIPLASAPLPDPNAPGPAAVAAKAPKGIPLADAVSSAGPAANTIPLAQPGAIPLATPPGNAAPPASQTVGFADELPPLAKPQLAIGQSPPPKALPAPVPASPATPLPGPQAPAPNVTRGFADAGPASPPNAAGASEVVGQRGFRIVPQQAPSVPAGAPLALPEPPAAAAARGLNSYARSVTPGPAAAPATSLAQGLSDYANTPHIPGAGAPPVGGPTVTPEGVRLPVGKTSLLTGEGSGMTGFGKMPPRVKSMAKGVLAMEAVKLGLHAINDADARDEFIRDPIGTGFNAAKEVGKGVIAMPGQVAEGLGQVPTAYGMLTSRDDDVRGASRAGAAKAFGDMTGINAINTFSNNAADGWRGILGYDPDTRPERLADDRFRAGTVADAVADAHRNYQMEHDPRTQFYAGPHEGVFPGDPQMGGHPNGKGSALDNPDPTIRAKARANVGMKPETPEETAKFMAARPGAAEAGMAQGEAADRAREAQMAAQGKAAEEKRAGEPTLAEQAKLDAMAGINGQAAQVGKDRADAQAIKDQAAAAMVANPQNPNAPNQWQLIGRAQWGWNGQGQPPLGAVAAAQGQGQGGAGGLLGAFNAQGQPQGPGQGGGFNPALPPAMQFPGMPQWRNPPTPTIITNGSHEETEKLGPIREGLYGMLDNMLAHGHYKGAAAVGNALSGMGNLGRKGDGAPNVTPGNPGEQFDPMRGFEAPDPTAAARIDHLRAQAEAERAKANLLNDPAKILAAGMLGGQDPAAILDGLRKMQGMQQGNAADKLRALNPAAANLHDDPKVVNRNPGSVIGEGMENGMFVNGQISTPADEAFARLHMQKFGAQKIQEELDANLGGWLNGGDVERRTRAKDVLQQMLQRYGMQPGGGQAPAQGGFPAANQEGPRTRPGFF